MKPETKKALACAAAAVVLTGAWLWLRVTLEYSGNITGLYYSGGAAATPPQLAGEAIHRIPGDRGYDAQFYHYVAHDPLLQRGLAAYVDNPRLRWRRIFVPGLAYVLALGTDGGVDAMYVAIMIAFVGLGVYWSALLLPGAWLGLAFLLIPAVLISLDRMTIDLPLAALCAGLIVYGEVRRSRLVFLVLAIAPLVRETGLLLVIGWCVWTALQQRWREAAIGAACAAPALAWWAFVQGRTPADQTPWLASYPLGGLIARTLDPPVIPQTGAWLRMAHLTEQLALLGIWAAFLCVLWILWKRRWSLAAITAITAAAFASMLGKYDIWADAYAAGRVLSPLLVMLAILAVQQRQAWLAMPMLLVLPRVLLQYQPVLKGVIARLLH